MFNLILSLGAILFCGGVAVFLNEAFNEKSFLKTVLSPTEYKVIMSLITLFMIVLFSPVLHIGYLKALSGDPSSIALLVLTCLPGVLAMYQKLREWLSPTLSS